MDNFFRDTLLAELEKLRSRTLGTVGGLAPHHLLWAPAGAVSNPIGFIFWHMGRREDMHLQNRIQDREQLWTAEGWNLRLGLDPEETGFGFTPDQVAAFPLPQLADLAAYYNRVRDNSIAYLKASSDVALQAPMPNAPETSIGVYLLARVTHEHEHWGQIDYLKSILPRR
ncbi:MAG: DinB family protein [Dehalococcoidia bacterium]|nr:DinB family protein [Dehalococcoidia bacterium]